MMRPRELHRDRNLGDFYERPGVRSGGRAIFVPTDVRRSEDIDRLIGETVREFGRLDVLVNNAGVLDGYATCLDTSPELFEQVMAIVVSRCARVWGARVWLVSRTINAQRNSAPIMSPSANLLKIFVEQITVAGIIMGTLDEFKSMMNFIVRAGIKPEIGEVIPMTDAERAIRVMAEGKTHGKTVFTR